MEALVVVLDDDLPVRRHLVAQPHADAQLVDAVAVEDRDALGALLERRQERLRRIGEVDEHEPGVRPDGDRVERVRLAVEVLVLVDVRRPDEPPVEVERPGVVRALERLADVPAQLAGLVEQLGPAVGAHVVERARLARLVARDDHRLAGDLADQEVARVRELLVAADADPAVEPDPLALVGVDGLARVVGARQRRARRPVAAAQVLAAGVAVEAGGVRPRSSSWVIERRPAGRRQETSLKLRLRARGRSCRPRPR